MTVIAWDGVTLAADKCATSGVVQNKVTKVYAAKWFDGDDVLVGCAGDMGLTRALKAHLHGAGPRPDPEKYDVQKGSTCGIAVKRDGSVYRISTNFELLPFDEHFLAVGNGAECALGAMYMGATARQAVEAASKYIEGCGLGVDELRFDNMVTSLSTRAKLTSPGDYDWIK